MFIKILEKKLIILPITTVKFASLRKIIVLFSHGNTLVGFKIWKTCEVRKKRKRSMALTG